VSRDEAFEVNLNRFDSDVEDRMRRGKMVKARPFVKWAGGKRKLAETYEAIGAFPRTFKRYYEPFVGGGAVFFRLQPEEAYLSDANEELINAYRIIKDRVDELVELLGAHQKEHEAGRKDYFYQIRALDPSKMSDPERAARLIFLNRTCFNGLYRVNQQGQFNVPYGRYKNPRILDERNLRNVSQLLENVTLENLDFENAVRNADENDFVYMDPPYRPISVTSSFTSYTERNFDDQEQERLRNVFSELAFRGCFVLESNSKAAQIVKMYEEDGYIITEVLAPRVISCKGDGRQPITELVISNYEFDPEGPTQTVLPP